VKNINANNIPKKIDKGIQNLQDCNIEITTNKIKKLNKNNICLGKKSFLKKYILRSDNGHRNSKLTKTNKTKTNHNGIGKTPHNKSSIANRGSNNNKITKT